MAIGINRTPEGWPNTADTIVNWPKKNIKDGVFIGKIINLPYGTYAISVLDDENNNAEMDRTLGMPREGYGFSNNPVVKLRPPSFEESSFKFDKPYMEIEIELTYRGKN